MSIKISSIAFRSFDLPSPLELKVLKDAAHIAQPQGKTLSLAASHPDQPALRTHAPELDLTPDVRQYRFTSELSPWMNDYYERIRDLSLRKDIMQRWLARQQQIAGDQLRHEVHVDLYRMYMTHLLFQRVYERVGRMSSLFRKIQTKAARETRRFAHEHREQRIEEAKLFPRLFVKALENPFLQEVKKPNQLKVFDFELIRIAQNLRMRKAKADNLFDLRRLSAEAQRLDVHERQRQTALHFHDKASNGILQKHLTIADNYEAVWLRTKEQFERFRSEIREGIIAQAELFPRLYRKAIVDIYNTEIKMPNDRDHYEKQQAHIDSLRAAQSERRDLLLIQRDLALNSRIAEQLDHISYGALRNKRRDAFAQDQNQRLINKAQAAAQGLIYVAGRQVPRIAIAIASDVKTTRPLSLGIHGNAATPELIQPVAPQNDPLFSATAGVRSIDGKLYEQSPEVVKMAERMKRHEARMVFLLGAASFGEHDRKEAFKIDPTEDHVREVKRKKKLSIS